MELNIGEELIIENDKYKCYEIFSPQNCWNCDYYRKNLLNNKECEFKCNSDNRKDNKTVFLKKIID